MVKADVKRNYYADLDLSPNADTQEITKAFRKLAILYHPDRNRGKEEEFVPKFQTIQTAHEVLSDPIARAKYDEDRRKYGYTNSFARPNNATKNPYAQSFYRPAPRPPPPARPQAAQPTPPKPPPAQTRPSYFNPQPSPPQYGYGQTPPYAQTPSPGSSTYTPFGRPAPPPPRQAGSAEDYQRRAQEWSAWSAMHNKPPTAKKTAEASKPAAKPSSVPPNKPGLGRSQTTKTPRKKGFDPSNPGEEWEPPATRTSSYTNFAKVPVSPMPPPPPGPPPRSGLSPNEGKKRHSIHETRRPVSADNVPFAEGNDRIRTPYTNHTGEKTYFSSAFLGRSASVRAPPAFAASENEDPRHPPSESNTGRARSNSPLRARSTATSQKSMGRQGQEATANIAKPRDKSKTPKTKSSIGLDYSSSEESSSSDLSIDRSSDIETNSKAPDAGSFGKPVQRNKAQPRRNIRNRTFNLGGGSETSSSTTSREFNGISARNDEGAPADASKPPGSVFNAPFYNPNVTPKARSEAEAVNTQFSTPDWHGKFEGSEFVPPPPSMPRQTRSQTRRATSPPKSASSSKLWFDNEAQPAEKPIDKPSAPSDQEVKPQRPPMTTKFSSEEWQRSFKAANWAFPPPPQVSSSTSPTRNGPAPTSRRGSRTSAAKKSNRAEAKIPSVQVTEEVDETPEALDKVRSTGPASAGSPLTKPKSAPRPSSLPKPRDSDAMDVDSSPPAPEILKGPRLVKLQTARPDWRDGSTLLTGTVPSISATSPVNSSNLPPPPPGPPPADSAPNRPQQNPSKPITSTISLSDFAKVTPLAPSGTGIQGLSDLAAGLPFSSQSSTSLTGSSPGKPLTPRKLELPPVPKGPDMPSPSTLLTQAQWKQLLAAMSIYMGNWYQFETKLLEHFSTRHAMAARFGVGLPSVEATKLLEQVGEPGLVQQCVDVAGGGGEGGGGGGSSVGMVISRMGLKAYRKELEEDRRVRKAWDLACERHQMVVEEFIAVKEGIVVNGLKVE